MCVVHMSTRAAAGDTRLTNLVGALVLALGERVRAATELATGQPAGGPAVLVTLDERARGASVDEIRQVVGLSPSGGVRLVDRLAQAGLVARRPGPDGRTLSVELTGAGRQAAARARSARATAVAEVLDVLEPGQRAALTTLVEDLLAALTRQRLDQRARGLVPPDGWLCRLCDFDACGRSDGRCPAARVVSGTVPADHDGPRANPTTS
jgi:MarR family transcriptional repressor of emrRAB